jgi:DNA-binding protein YbaB
MEQPNLNDLQSATDEMKRLVDRLMDGFDQQAADLPGVCERLATSRSTVWSSDRLAEVTVDAYGVVLEVRLADNAFMNGTPNRLAGSITEAAKEAARVAQERRAEILAPITELGDALPDLPDLFPGMASLREIRETVGAATRTRIVAPAEMNGRPVGDDEEFED